MIEGDVAAAPSPVRHRNTCRLCEGSDLVKVIALAPSPPANAFVPVSALHERQPEFPLDVWFCNRCGHVQLLDVVDAAVLFRDYVYTSGTSPVFVDHFRHYAGDVVRRFGLERGDLVVEIGSNDGTLLRFFQASGNRVLGIDPAVAIARRATDEGIETLPAFFTPSLAEEIRDQHGVARVVVANNVFAHIDDLSSVVEGLRTLLAPDGVFAFEVSYLLDVFQKTLFDTIYHEHLDYHTTNPLIPFFARHGLRLFDVERVNTHGGSLRGFACHAQGRHETTDRVGALTELEHRAGLDRPDAYQDFSARIDRLGGNLLDLLRKLRADGAHVAGFGAPAKATTLMYHFSLGPDLLDFIVDDSPLKQGLFTPGYHIPVVPSGAIYERRPDYLLILAWNFAGAIMQNHRLFRETGGRFIVPLPELEIV